MESIHTLGLALMIIEVLPKLDVIRCILVMCGVGVVPSLLNVIFGLRPRHNTLKKVGFIILDIIAVLFQMSAIAFVILVDFGSSQGKT